MIISIDKLIDKEEGMFYGKIQNASHMLWDNLGIDCDCEDAGDKLHSFVENANLLHNQMSNIDAYKLLLDMYGYTFEIGEKWEHKRIEYPCKFVNLTPHPINIINGDIIPSSGKVRISEEFKLIDKVDGIDIYSVTYGDVEGLPNPTFGVKYIVSAMIRNARPNRLDLFSPGELVRNKDGSIIGCKGLIGNG